MALASIRLIGSVRLSLELQGGQGLAVPQGLPK